MKNMTGDSRVFGFRWQVCLQHCTWPWSAVDQAQFSVDKQQHMEKCVESQAQAQALEKKHQGISRDCKPVGLLCVPEPCQRSTVRPAGLSICPCRFPWKASYSIARVKSVAGVPILRKRSKASKRSLRLYPEETATTDMCGCGYVRVDVWVWA